MLNSSLYTKYNNMVKKKAKSYLEKLLDTYDPLNLKEEMI